MHHKRVDLDRARTLQVRPLEAQALLPQVSD